MKRTLKSAATVVGFFCCGGVVVGQATPVGSELQVNTEIAGSQFDPATAMDADGDFVVVWTSYGQDADVYSFGIVAQRYDSSGGPLGGELQVNTYGSSNQTAPAVAMDDDGDFVVVWTGSGHQDGEGAGVFAQLFDSAGLPAGGELQVNSHFTGDQDEPAVAMDGDGDFVVVWTSGGGGVPLNVVAQRFDAAGVHLGPELEVDSDLNGYQALPSVAASEDGNFVVVWQNRDQYGYSDIFARRFDSSGTPGVAFQVNSSTAGSHVRPAVASAAGGDFVVAWSSYPSYPQDGSGSGVFARRFDASGTPAGADFLVNSTTTSSQFEPTVAAEGGGDFVVAWTSYGQDGSLLGVFAQVFDASGTPEGGELMVNSTTAGYQYQPAVGVDDEGDFVVAWTSYPQDGDAGGIFAQRFDGAENDPGLTVTIDVKPDSAVNTINLKSNGLIHVAILTTSDFDAWDADPATVAFGPALAPPHGSANAQDVDSDGDLDMTLRFRIQDAGLGCGDASATLIGETNDGEPFEASDSVLISGC